MAASKNIVICCDGTGNSFDNPSSDSNVVKLYSTIVIDAHQAGYYHPGVGTMGAPTARGRFEKQWTRVKGLAFGSGLLDNVGDAYRYLINIFDEGDRIFLFGFSRGAYTARAIASVLHVFGLLFRGNEDLIPYILRLYSEITKQAKRGTPVFETEQNFQDTFARVVSVHFCGLWDTVSSYGWIYSPIDLPFAGQNPIILKGRHAVSIDEHRCCYQSNLWGPPLAGQDIRQVWFSGVHSDVGGSYPEVESGLAKITLEWMLLEAESAGLLIDHDRASVVLGLAPRPRSYLPPFVQPDSHALMHESLRHGWWILEYLPRKNPSTKGSNWSLPLGSWRRKIPAGSVVHQSVYDGRRAESVPDDSIIEQWTRFKLDRSEAKPLSSPHNL